MIFDKITANSLSTIELSPSRGLITLLTVGYDGNSAAIALDKEQASLLYVYLRNWVEHN